MHAFLQRLRAAFLFRFRRPELKIDPKSIKYAFTSGGIAYYTFRDQFSMPAKRYQEYLVKYEEMTMGLRRPFMEKWVKDALACFTPTASGKNAGILDLNRLHELLIEIKARLEIAPIGDDIYAYLSVLFFPLDENLIGYDPQFNRKKIDRWKQEPVLDFFLQTPVKELLPFTSVSRDSLEAFLKEQTKTLTLMGSASSST